MGFAALYPSYGLRRYKKATRGPKKAPVKRQNDPAKPTVSTARLLAARKGRAGP